MKSMLRCSLILALAVLATVSVWSIERDVVISVYQGPCQDGDFATNLARTREVVAEARARGSHFLALPEAFLSGYTTRQAVERGARALEDPELAEFIKETAAHEMVVVVGFARRASDGLYNSVLVIQRGQRLGFYDKVMLTGADLRLGFRPGTAAPVFAAHGLKFGAIIGQDASFLHGALAARLQGAELLFTPHREEIEAASADARRWVRNCQIGLAAQLKTAVARASAAQTDGPDRVGEGDSFVLSPLGEPLVEAKRSQTGLITATLEPALFTATSTGADFAEVPAWLRTQLGAQLTDFRRPVGAEELRYWLENMVLYHRFSSTEVAAATGRSVREMDWMIRELGFAREAPPARPAGAPLVVLPYPGGRHPRIGFLEGAIAPQRETKVSVFAPWPEGGYAVVDVPEAIFSNLGLLYLAHTHVPTLWSERNLELGRLEWNRHKDGVLTSERTLPNGVAFGTRVVPETNAVRFAMWLRNGTDQPLSGLRVQNCVMLKALRGFEAQSNENKVFEPPYAACRSADGRRWLVTAWDPLHRVWANPPVPCVHSDPKFPDCAPGATVTLRGWFSFYEGTNVQAEFQRIERTAWR